ncbi:hypothetical protein RFI_11835 [Reticulomyxa filosa]|uniref:Uncharacterized protein n=1 Tax=Reticulomyxa filosa TaxID=46433 RepID=X6NG45_RETFI|nr:hypothetical protein RFI_11835 [Reticulomyxa filosa]|eukprot:ETO25300.1 hypothetical protein RFI_11835 [Reticulomyxa filosa]
MKTIFLRFFRSVNPRDRDHIKKNLHLKLFFTMSKNRKQGSNGTKSGDETPKTETKQPYDYLIDQIAFYGAYHSTLGNQIIHIIFVPVILITALSMLSFVKILMQPVNFLWFGGEILHTNTPLFIIFVLMYPATYVYIDFYSGLSWLPMASFVWFAAMFLVDNLKWPISSLLLLHSVAWIFQFIGHGVIERRKPALLDNLYQSIVLAPFFVWFETVLFPLGYGNSVGLKRNITRKVKELQVKLDNKP